MKTIEEVLKTVPGTKAEDWHQHGNGKGWVYSSASVADSAYVGPNALVYGDARVYGNARVSGVAWVFGDAQVSGNAQVSGDAWKTTPLFVQGTKHGATNCKYGWLAIGCQVRTFADWQANVETIAEENGYTKEEAAEYRAIVDFMTKVGK